MYLTFDDDSKRCTIEPKGYIIIVVVVVFVGTQFKQKGLHLNHLADTIGQVKEILFMGTTIRIYLWLNASGIWKCIRVLRQLKIGGNSNSVRNPKQIHESLLHKRTEEKGHICLFYC